MKILHLSNNLIPGGAGKATRTINLALQYAGMESSRLDVPLLTQWDHYKSTFRAYYDKLPLQRYNRNPKTAFSTANIGMGIQNFEAVKNADILHLHWVHQGYMGFSDLEYISTLNKKVFISMHDSWWLSGGCHVTHGCNQWMNGCGACPQLNSSRANDLSFKIFKRKQAILKKINPTIICASRWMYQRASNSPMFAGFKIIRIPYCIDLEKYFPDDKKSARIQFNLPENKKLILFGSVDINDSNKGFIYFRDAVNAIEEDDIELVIFGNLPDYPLGLNKKVNALGLLKEEHLLRLAYSAADVFVAPSLEDNFPNTVLESISCGTPVTAFNIGGMPDMIDHQENGFLADSKNTTQLRDGIVYCLKNIDKMTTFARKKAVENFSFKKIAGYYADCYK